MSVTDPTELHLLRGIIASPADDTPRLVYADWLDEHGQHERAELIRVQCELARLRTNWPQCRHLPESSSELCRVKSCNNVRIAHALRVDGLESRERELLTDARRREWAGQHEDLLGWDNCTWHFRRGFVERVEVPELEWVFGFVPPKWDNPLEWTVTPWALAVAGTHPVTEFVMGDREPVKQDAAEEMWCWFSSEAAARFGLDDHPEGDVPQVIIDAMPAEKVDGRRKHRPRMVRSEGGGYVTCYSREQALAALATAAADVVRAAVLAAWAKEVRT